MSGGSFSESSVGMFTERALLPQAEKRQMRYNCSRAYSPRSQAFEKTFEILAADNHIGILIRSRKGSRSLCFHYFVGEPGNCGELPIPITIAGAGTDLQHARSRLAKHDVGHRRAMWGDNHTRAGEQVCLFPPGKIFGFDNFEIPMPQDL